MNTTSNIGTEPIPNITFGNLGIYTEKSNLERYLNMVE